MKYVVFDTETGGLNPKKNSLLTAYVAVIDFTFGEYETLDELNIKVKHDEYFCEESALKINGINLKEHSESSDSLTVEDACEKIQTFCIKNHLSFVPVLGQNVDFDIQFLKEMFESVSMKYPFFHRKVDLMSVWLFLQEKGKIHSKIGLRLGNMCEFFNINYEGAHDAKQDCVFVCEVYKRLLSLEK